MKEKLLNNIKKFYHQNIIKAICAISVIIIITTIIIIWQYNKPVKEIEILLPEITDYNKNSNIAKDIVEFLPVENPPVAKHTTVTPKKIEPSNQKEGTIDNDYLIDLYQKINLLTDNIKTLQQEVTSLKTQQKSNSDNNNILGVILIELYRIKNLALLGADFSTKIPALLLITKDNTQIQQNLITLQAIKQLPKQQEIENLLIELENNILKQQAKNNLAKDNNIANKIKLNLWEYIKIKKVKNLSQESPLWETSNIRQAIKAGNFEEAYITVKKLTETYHFANLLSDKLSSFHNFNTTLNDLFSIILSQTVYVQN